jgi:hypothetical protein
MEPNPPQTDQATIPDLDRVAFFDGQRLAAGDLNAAAAVQRALRWLHNRSLHGWGIGLGFAVAGTKGDRQVQISPGYAIDCLGREIILAESVTKPVPAKAGDAKGKPVIFYLVAAYPDDADLTVIERREGECGTDGATRLRDQAALYWKAQGEQAVAEGMEIVLAQASIQNCALAAPLSLDQRRSARPPQQPNVAAGETNSGDTPWEVWTVPNGDGTSQVGLQTFVDTSSARFGSTPLYHARLAGNLSPFEFQESLMVFDGLTLVTDATAAGFTFRVLLPAQLQIGNGGVLLNSADFLAGDLKTFAAPRARNTWSVVWVGVEG